MYNLIKRAADAFAGLIVGLAVAAVLMGPAAMALVFPGQYAPRYFPTQQVHYERHVVNFAVGPTTNSTVATVDSAQNTCIFTITATCSVRFGAVPYNAYIVRAYQQVVTACNGTSCTLAIGTSSGSANLVAAQAITSAGGSTALTVVAANAGIAATGNNIASSGADGGFDLYMTFADATSGATAGTIVVVIEYFGSNDGGCNINVPIPTLANTVGPC